MNAKVLQFEHDAEVIPLRRAVWPVAVGFVVYIVIFFGAAVLAAGAVHRAGHHQCDVVRNASSAR